MSRLEHSFKLFSKNGMKFLLLELIIVFLGVYLAFLFQNYSENQKLKTEKEKIMIGLKEDLEYFRIFFPGFISSMNNDIEGWNQLIADDSYEDFSDWRFIQPQYDYTVVEYALDADAEVIDFEMNSSLSKLYTELEKLRQAEELITITAQNYKAVPPNESRTTEIQILHANNLLNQRRLANRAQDRVGIMQRVATLSEENLKQINAEFSDSELKEIELLLIGKRASDIPPNQTEFYIQVLKQFFPNLTEEEIRDALSSE